MQSVQDIIKTEDKIKKSVDESHISSLQIWKMN